MNPLCDRVQALQGRIRRACERCGRDPVSVELLPVSKRQPLALIQHASLLGFRTFGENYVQEGSGKAQALPDLRFLLIGPLQRNKAKAALEHFQEIMTIDRPELALRLQTLAAERKLARRIWLQVDLWDEDTKMGGCPASGISPLLQLLEADPWLTLQGFMAIPPPGIPQAFADLTSLRDAWQQKLGQPLRLSMGMSDDLEAAIAAGSDQVRIGTAFFGERTPSPDSGQF
jgi:pyridoxal phosphate enzyme (YggS family)